MSKKIERKDRHFKFETLQLHVGQESPDPVTDARAVPIYRHLLMYSETAIMQQLVSDLQMQVTFTDVLQTRLKMYSRKESQRLKAVLRHLQ